MEPGIGVISLRTHGMKPYFKFYFGHVFAVNFIFSIVCPECLGALLWRVNKIFPGTYQVLL